jgi:iron complex transport system substrate-binding protein
VRAVSRSARRVAVALAIALAAIAAPAIAAAASAGGGGEVTWLGPRPPARPRRVVSIAPSLTDLVVAMGLADRLVGVTRFDDAPEVARLPRVGGYLDPSAEAVVALRPDLAVWIDDDGGVAAVRRIADSGVPVMVLRVVGVRDVVAGARTLGRALGEAAAGERVARELSESLARARAAGSAPRPRVLFVLGHEPLVVAGPGSYPDELLRLAGGENVVRDARPWSFYPVESAVADDPTLVIDAGVLEPPETLARLVAIAAVRRGDVRRLSDDSALRPGPRFARALAELARILHSAGEVAPARAGGTAP